jgi:hypothetical protein
MGVVSRPRNTVTSQRQENSEFNQRMLPLTCIPYLPDRRRRYTLTETPDARLRLSEDGERWCGRGGMGTHGTPQPKFGPRPERETIILLNGNGIHKHYNKQTYA